MFKTVQILEYTSLLPVEVQEDIRCLWADQELGNYTSYYLFEVDDEWRDETYNHLNQFLKDHNKKEVLVHFWW